MRVASWNVNSAKARLNHITGWLAADNADVLLLQEIKSQTENFPRDLFVDKGWHVAVHGQKSYNGVAIIAVTHRGCDAACPAIRMTNRRVISRQ